MATQENRSMVSEVSICNQALLWLGEEPITSLEDNTNTAIWMKNNYPFVRDAVLEERMWTFATAREDSTVNDVSTWGGQYVHPKPVSWISVFRVYRNVNSADPREWLPSRGWRMEGNNVLTDESTVFMWGILRVTDTGAFSPMFVQALAARLAADAAIPLTENRQLQGDMWALYQGKLDTAAARDGMQGLSDKVSRGRMVSSRGIAGGGRY